MPITKLPYMLNAMPNAGMLESDARGKPSAVTDWERGTISLDLTAGQLEELDDWIATSLAPEQSRSEAVHELVCEALGIRAQRKDQAQRSPQQTTPTLLIFD
jgi:hypothetical protein